jgi:hypothetical protein
VDRVEGNRIKLTRPDSGRGSIKRIITLKRTVLVAKLDRRRANRGRAASSGDSLAHPLIDFLIE